MTGKDYVVGVGGRVDVDWELEDADAALLPAGGTLRCFWYL